MESDLHSRINAMFYRDLAMAACLVFLVWLTIAFVYLAIDQFVGDPVIRAALLIGAAFVLVFNTAAIVAMVRHYMEDKFHIYSLDIRHLDENRARIAATKSQAKRAETATARS